MSVDTFRGLYKPHYRRMSDWVHTHTNWKTLLHTYGAVSSYLDGFVGMGMDIFYPVQLSAAGMHSPPLKARCGDKLVFWGGGVNTREALPKGTPEEIAVERLKYFSIGGGDIFAPIHNTIEDAPAGNALAAYEAVAEMEA